MHTNDTETLKQLISFKTSDDYFFISIPFELKELFKDNIANIKWNPDIKMWSAHVTYESKLETLLTNYKEIIINTLHKIHSPNTTNIDFSLTQNLEQTTNVLKQEKITIEKHLKRHNKDFNLKYGNSLIKLIENFIDTNTDKNKEEFANHDLDYNELCLSINIAYQIKPYQLAIFRKELDKMNQTFKDAHTKLIQQHKFSKNIFLLSLDNKPTSEYIRNNKITYKDLLPIEDLDEEKIKYIKDKSYTL
ncbi:MAG: hypothetical protein VX185_00585 [Pseudomonadota bacterium]|nr:hypothetical protein [Pseudomonadota bacterium]